MNIPALPGLNGIQIIQSPIMTERKLFQMCRSKKKRIRKKWLKNPKNYKMIPMNHYVFDKQKRTIFCHPIIAKRIIKAIDNQEHRHV